MIRLTSLLLLLSSSANAGPLGAKMAPGNVSTALFEAYGTVWASSSFLRLDIAYNFSQTREYCHELTDYIQHEVVVAHSAKMKKKSDQKFHRWIQHTAAMINSSCRAVDTWPHKHTLDKDKRFAGFLFGVALGVVGDELVHHFLSADGDNKQMKQTIDKFRKAIKTLIEDHIHISQDLQLIESRTLVLEAEMIIQATSRGLQGVRAANRLNTDLLPEGAAYTLFQQIRTNLTRQAATVPAGMTFRDIYEMPAMLRGSGYTFTVSVYFPVNTETLRLYKHRDDFPLAVPTQDGGVRPAWVITDHFIAVNHQLNVYKAYPNLEHCVLLRRNHYFCPTVFFERSLQLTCIGSIFDAAWEQVAGLCPFQNKTVRWAAAEGTGTATNRHVFVYTIHSMSLLQQCPGALPKQLHLAAGFSTLQPPRECTLANDKLLIKPSRRLHEHTVYESAIPWGNLSFTAAFDLREKMLAKIDLGHQAWIDIDWDWDMTHLLLTVAVVSVAINAIVLCACWYRLRQTKHIKYLYKARYRREARDEALHEGVQLE